MTELKQSSIKETWQIQSIKLRYLLTKHGFKRFLDGRVYKAGNLPKGLQDRFQRFVRFGEDLVIIKQVARICVLGNSGILISVNWICLHIVGLGWTSI